MMPSIYDVEGRPFADHTRICFRIWHPDGSMVIGSFFAALLQQIPDTSVDMCHPFLLFTSSGRVHGKALSSGANQPTVSVLTFIFQRLKLDLFQGNYMLFVVLFLVQNNVAIDQKVVEKEKLPGFWFFPASFG